jgi:signal transduction histidine kinase
MIAGPLRRGVEGIVQAVRNGPGLRARLTLLYGGLFFVAGTALLWVTYLLTARTLDREFYMPDMPPLTSLPLGDTPRRVAILINKDVAAKIQDSKAEVLSDLVKNSALIMIAIGLLALLLGYLVAARALRPLQQVTDTAERLSESTLHERIALSGPDDDLKRLADTFDAMLDRLQRAFDAQRRFVLNASHELRTPLAVNRTLLEVAMEEPDVSGDLVRLGKALLDTNVRHERLIEGLLLLARSEHEMIVRKPVDVDEVVHGVLDLLAPTAQRRRISLTPSPELTGPPAHDDLAWSPSAVVAEPVMAAGDPLLIERCVFNLVENAIKYNVKDGMIRVDVTPESGNVAIRVENTGPLIPAYEVADLFEPFRRLLDRVGSARGSGLGLSIVRAIASAHSGTAEATARKDGGLIVTVRLPAHLPASSPRTRG